MPQYYGRHRRCQKANGGRPLNALCKLLIQCFGAAVLALFLQTAHAHSTGENYVFLNIDDDALRVRVELHQNDLDAQFGIELQDTVPDEASLQTVLGYVADHFQVSAFDQPLVLSLAKAELMSLPQGIFLQLHLETTWVSAVPDSLTIKQNLFFERNPRHRGLLLIERNTVAGRDFGEEYTALVFRPDNEVQELDLVNVPGLLQKFDDQLTASIIFQRPRVADRNHRAGYRRRCILLVLVWNSHLLAAGAEVWRWGLWTSRVGGEAAISWTAPLYC